MAVGASFTDLAIILLDATQGILKQTKLHIRICKLMRIRYFVFTINKMDLVDYDEYCFQKISTDIKNFVKELDLENIKINEERIEENFIMSVQRICRPDYTFRGI